MSSNYTIGTLSGNTTGTLTGKDYTSEFDRIADALEAISSTLVQVKTSIDNLTTASNLSNTYLQNVSKHFQVERAILVAVDLSSEDKPKVVSEINNPTLP